MLRRGFLKTLAVATISLVSAFGYAWAAYPERPITIIVPWAAGGGTDATARIIGSLLEKELGQPVNVVNRTGGSGVVGHEAIAAATPDGYTLGLATVEIGMLHWQGLTQRDYKDYTPIALMNLDPAGVQVRADAPYKTVNELLDDIKKNPGKFKASGTGQGGIWHLAIAGMLDSLAIDPSTVRWVPSQGAAPGLQDLVAGGVEVVPCSLPEARSLIDAGRVKSIAIMNPERNPAFPNVPTLAEQTGSQWEIGAWRGIVGPKDMPADVTKRLAEALDKIYKSKEYNDFMNQRGFGMKFAAGEEFLAFWKKSDEDLGAVMKKVGLAK
ncbi:Bug family tripartite tricarboxylate transporter substrate binding protein [Microvirga makkahensis]|uniref:Tripartite tricarboxylate transporter substrate binding protein n=1 Tax=Microvirga makkahensis TaxID=1128670 RepID=A0A7X3SN20_9HYPH|nr:tripartite tricarboxylate transporter substrate binding protein [Microvirga makkahensis]MXQ10609.1 tripartite tricarboxylate transporter substrate binding protein [Microvirga makkahensis]